MSRRRHRGPKRPKAEAKSTPGEGMSAYSVIPMSDGWRVELSAQGLLVTANGTSRAGVVHATVSVHRGDRLLHRDRLNLTSAKSRRAFVIKLHKMNEAIPEGALIALDEAIRQPRTEEEASAAAEIYRETPQGLVWIRPTREGAVPVRLTNFVARIVEDIADDDGVEVRRRFVIDIARGDDQQRIVVPAAAFAAMHWPLEHLGVGAVVAAGFGVSDHARAAIQQFSSGAVKRRVYKHTGWRLLDSGWAYLHGGGGIDANGLVPGVEVALPDALGRYVLPSPASDTEAAEAVRAALRIEGVADSQITMPLLAAPARAVLGSADFSIHLVGPTGAGKTVCLALIQQFFGPEHTADHLPAHWSSTPNALEGLAFAAKDAVLGVDDLVLTGSMFDAHREHRDVDRVLRAQGNRSGRLRMRSDASLRAPRPPRGLLLSTGEETPRGHSLRARVWIIEMGRDDLDWDRITQCQHDAAAGLYALALAGFIRWLAPQYEDVLARLPGDLSELREAAAANAGAHRRTPTIVANLALGLRYWLRFASAVGAVTESEAKHIWREGWQTFTTITTQVAQQRMADPARRFLELLNAAIASGKAHVTDDKGEMPGDNNADCRAWGWQHVPDVSGNGNDSYRPQGDRIGWLIDEDLLLEPDASLAVAQRLARDEGEPLLVAPKTLHRRLKDAALLASTDVKRGTLTVRKTLDSKRMTVLHIRADSLTGSATDQSAQPDHRNFSGVIPRLYPRQVGQIGQEVRTAFSPPRRR